MAKLESLEDLKDWTEYRDYMRQALKQVGQQPEPCFVSRERFDFEIKGSTWKGFPVVVGKRARTMVKAFRNGGLPFLEGTVTVEGKQVRLQEFKTAQLKGAERTFTKLKLPFELDLGDLPDDADDQADQGEDSGALRELERLKQAVVPEARRLIEAGGEAADRVQTLLRRMLSAERDGNVDDARRILEGLAPFLRGARRTSEEEEEEEVQASTGGSTGGDDAELPAKARTLEQAVQVWQRTEEAARNEVRKLQRAILAADAERGRGIARGLETILDELDSIEDEAREAARAAADSAREQFDRARDVLLRKMERMRREVESNELIRDAEDNPLVPIKIRETISRSLDQLLRAV